MSIRVRLTLSLNLLLLLLLILWRHGRLRRLILSVLIVLLLLLHHRSVRPSLILRLEFPAYPRSLKRFSVRDWIVRRSVHVFADRDPTRAE